MYPIFLKLGGATFYTYEVLIWTGILAGTLLSTGVARRLTIRPGLFLSFVAVAVAGGWLGARLIFVATRWTHYSQHPGQILNFLDGGYVYYGGIFGAMALASLWHRFRGLPLAPYLDAAAPGLAVGQVFSRLGCYGGGCCYGMKHESLGLVFTSHQEQMARLPTQLLESLFGLLVAWLLLKRSRKIEYPGQLITWFLASYAIFRFMMEFIRDDQHGVWIGVLSVSQSISVTVLAVLGLVAWHRKTKRDNA